jgi:hypothetical protein
MTDMEYLNQDPQKEGKFFHEGTHSKKNIPFIVQEKRDQFSSALVNCIIKNFDKGYLAPEIVKKQMYTIWGNTVGC